MARILSVSAGLCAALVGVASVKASHQDSAGPYVDYARVNLIFRKYDCTDCHTEDANAQSGLHLCTLSGLLAGGNRGKAVSLVHPSESLIVKCLRGGGDGIPKMPPQGNLMKSEDRKVIEDYIEQGAPSGKFSDAMQLFYDSALSRQWKLARGAAVQIGDLRIDGAPTKRLSLELQLEPDEQLGEEDAWYSVAHKLLADAADGGPEGRLNADFLNRLAWEIVDPESKWKRRDAALGLKAAQLAAEDCQRKSGAILDTLAWAEHWSGHDKMAVETEREALKCADAKGALKDALEKDLRSFGG